jgi:hypothetical protein
LLLLLLLLLLLSHLAVAMCLCLLDAEAPTSADREGGLHLSRRDLCCASIVCASSAPVVGLMVSKKSLRSGLCIIRQVCG